MDTNAAANVAIARYRPEREIAPDLWDSIMSRAATTDRADLANMAAILESVITRGMGYATPMYVALHAEVRGMAVARFGAI